MKKETKQRLKQLIKKIITSFKSFPYLPRWVVLIIDLFISIFTFTLTYLFYYQLQDQVIFIGPYLFKLSINVVLSLVFFVVYKTYVGIIRYSTFRDGVKVFLAAISIYLSLLLMNFVMDALWGYEIFSAMGLFINFLLTFSGMFLFRMVVRLIYDIVGSDGIFGNRSIPILIFDITPATVAIAELIKNTSSSPYHLIGFLTFDDKDNNKTILGVPFYSMNKKDQLKIKEESPKALLINPNEQGRREKQAIANYCEANGLKILALPAVPDWKKDAIVIEKIKDIQIEDLLGRVPINISVEKIAQDLQGKCVMVTGAAGSIGSEIVRQLGQFQPGLLLLCDIAESPLHNLQLELEDMFPSLKFLPLIGDVRNQGRMEKIFEKYKPAHIYHAAAYKHVPLMEIHPCESIYTNVFGTKNMVDLALKYGAEAFVMISTDKAVNPTNVMGASKRIAEIYVQTLYKEIQNNKKLQNTNLRIITTRFGNVLGSNGSVIPRFKHQIEKGGPVTVTHPEIIRYFMTIREACRLVLEAANMGKGGEIFVFDMGSPVKIVDLAKKMIRLAGLKPNEDIQINFTGLRLGEKLYEELLADEETTKPTYNKKIMIGTVRDTYEYKEVIDVLDRLYHAVVAYEDKKVVKTMKELVPEFISSNSFYEVLDSN